MNPLYPDNPALHSGNKYVGTLDGVDIYDSHSGKLRWILFVSGPLHYPKDFWCLELKSSATEDDRPSRINDDLVTRARALVNLSS